VDLVFTPAGALVELVLELSDGEATVAPRPELVVGPDALRPAV